VFSIHVVVYVYGFIMICSAGNALSSLDNDNDKSSLFHMNIRKYDIVMIMMLRHEKSIKIKAVIIIINFYKLFSV